MEVASYEEEKELTPEERMQWLRDRVGIVAACFPVEMKLLS